MPSQSGEENKAVSPAKPKAATPAQAPPATSTATVTQPDPTPKSRSELLDWPKRLEFARLSSDEELEILGIKDDSLPKYLISRLNWSERICYKVGRILIDYVKRIEYGSISNFAPLFMMGFFGKYVTFYIPRSRPQFNLQLY